ncbi:MAG TPA: cupin domain-containing protein [Acidimicrobiia bacterium]
MVVLVVALAVAGLVTVISAGASQTTTQNGITRTILAQTAPDNAPRQELYLEEVKIAPKAKLGTHYHDGTQIAHVTSGVLTYNIVSGTASVTRADGSAEEATGPTTIRLRPGDSVAETKAVVHYGANKGTKPVVILIAALLAEDAPLATPAPDTQS